MRRQCRAVADGGPASVCRLHTIPTYVIVPRSATHVHRSGKPVSHTVRDKTKLLNRVRRIRGQLAAIEHALEAEEDASKVLHTIAAARGAMNGLMAEVLEGHIRMHVLDPEQRPTAAQIEAAEKLIDVLGAYLK